MNVKLLMVTGFGIASAYVDLPVNAKFELNGLNYLLDYIPPSKLTALSRLVKAGDEHAKIMRFVWAYFDIIAPRFWWQQWATYKIGMEMYSASTMHVRPTHIHNSVNDGVDPRMVAVYHEISEEVMGTSLPQAVKLRILKSNLPEGFLQRRVVMVNYQTLRRVWKQRRSHRLPEWAVFLDIIETLPYANELIFTQGEEQRK